jgi:hypothetical protein
VARQAVDNLNAQEAELKVAGKKLEAQLANVPVESVAFSGGDGKSFDHATEKLLNSKDAIRIKLDLLPGIRVRFQAQAEGLRQQIRVAVKALTWHCRDLASAKLEQSLAQAATGLLPHYGGNLERARVAAARAMQGPGAWDLPGAPAQACDAWKWQETFTHFTHASDAVEDAETVIGMAESFARGETCD